MAPGFIPLAVRTCLEVFRDVSVHPGPPEVRPHKLDCLVLSEVSGHCAVNFGFENGWYHKLRKVEASTVEENVVGFHCQMLRWFDIIVAVWVSAERMQN